MCDSRIVRVAIAESLQLALLMLLHLPSEWLTALRFYADVIFDRFIVSGISYDLGWFVKDGDNLCFIGLLAVFTIRPPSDAMSHNLYLFIMLRSFHCFVCVHTGHVLLHVR